MRILLISNVYPPGFLGGYELGAYDVTEHLRQLGHEVQVLTSDYFVDTTGNRNITPVTRELECPALAHQLRGQQQSPLDGPLHNWRNTRRIATALQWFNPDVVLAFNLAGLGPVGFFDFL
jgi:hypothetical protein